MSFLTIGLGIGIIAFTILALTGKGRYFLKGCFNLFFQDLAKTPKGAEAIYAQAIEEATNAYSKASNNLQRIAGMLNTSENNLTETSNKINTTKQKMEEFAKRQQWEKVDLYAEELSSLEEDIKLYQNEVIKYKPMLEQAKMLSNQYESKLTKLKKDKKIVVRQLEMNQQTKDMYDDLDSLKQTKTSDKLLDSVKEGLIETEEMATGAKILHNSKRSTKLLEADNELKSSEFNKYALELKNRYKKEGK